MSQLTTTQKEALMDTHSQNEAERTWTKPRVSVTDLDLTLVEALSLQFPGRWTYSPDGPYLVYSGPSLVLSLPPLTLDEISTLIAGGLHILPTAIGIYDPSVEDTRFTAFTGDDEATARRALRSAGCFSKSVDRNTAAPCDSCALEGGYPVEIDMDGYLAARRIADQEEDDFHMFFLRSGDEVP